MNSPKDDQVWKQQQLSAEEIAEMKALVGKAESDLEDGRDKVVRPEKKSDEQSVGEEGSDNIAGFVDKYTSKPEGPRGL